MVLWFWSFFRDFRRYVARGRNCVTWRENPSRENPSPAQRQELQATGIPYDDILSTCRKCLPDMSCMSS